MTKQDKKDVEYSLGMIKTHCGKVFDDDKGYCAHYTGNKLIGKCAKVDGPIDPIYWCKLFSRAVYG